MVYGVSLPFLEVLCAAKFDFWKAMRNLGTVPFFQKYLAGDGEGRSGLLETLPPPGYVQLLCKVFSSDKFF